MAPHLLTMVHIYAYFLTNSKNKKIETKLLKLRFLLANNNNINIKLMIITEIS